MNKITCSIIEKLVANSGYAITMDSLSEKYSVSKRMIYNYCDEINDFFHDNGCEELIRIKKGSIAFAGDAQDGKKVLRLLSSLGLYDYRANASERVNLILLLLAIEHDFIKIESMEEILSISRATLINDMKTVRKRLDHIGAEFSENKHFGFSIDYPEIQKRDMIYYVIQEMCDDNKILFSEAICNPAINYARKLLKIDRYYLEASRAISFAEEKNKVDLSDYDYYSLVIILCIMMNRIESGNDIYLNNTDFKENNASIRDFANDIRDYLQKYIPISEQEYCYLCLCLRNFHFIINRTSISSSPINFHVLVKNLLYTLSNYYRIQLTDDDILHEYLTAHLSACYHRFKNGEILVNPFKEEIIRNFESDFLFLKENVGILEECFNKKIGDDELTYILMHILAAIERMKLPRSLARIIVTSNAGIANANMLATAIREHFNVEISDILSVHTLYQKIDSIDCDFIVSTTPIDSKVPCVVVNAVLEDENYQMISEAISAVRKKNHSSVEPSTAVSENIPADGLLVSDHLSENKIILNKEVSDWKEALISAGELLLWDNAISVNYLNQMISLVLKYGPYIVFADGIALAHASPGDGVQKTAFSFVRLKKPVLFDNSLKPVNIIIAFAINDTPAETAMLINFMNIINIPEFNKKLMEAGEKSEIIEIISEYEERRPHKNQSAL
jgi:transcriptional antiterminator/mannitol/fructose-specific phosphotransferase system IIA component (Ntr-type)